MLLPAGFAAGATIYLVMGEFIPEALEAGADIDGDGNQEIVIGVLLGGITMVLLLVGV